MLLFQLEDLQKFRNNWNAILDKGIDMNNLTKFDVTPHLGTVLEETSHTTLIFCKKCLDTNVFPREDYKELCQLTIMWLGGVVENFQFQWPGPVHHARFIAKAIYYLKMQLTSTYTTIFRCREVGNLIDG